MFGAQAFELKPECAIFSTRVIELLIQAVLCVDRGEGRRGGTGREATDEGLSFVCC